MESTELGEPLHCLIVSDERIRFTMEYSEYEKQSILGAHWDAGDKRVQNVFLTREQAQTMVEYIQYFLAETEETP